MLHIQAHGFGSVFGAAHVARQRLTEWHPPVSTAPAPMAGQVKRLCTMYLSLATNVAAVGLVVGIAEGGLTLFAERLVFSMVNTVRLDGLGPLVISGIEDDLTSRRTVRVAGTWAQVSVAAAT